MPVIDEDSQLKAVAESYLKPDEVDAVTVAEDLNEFWPNYGNLSPEEQERLQERVHELFHSADVTVTWDD